MNAVLVLNFKLPQPPAMPSGVFTIDDFIIRNTQLGTSSHDPRGAVILFVHEILPKIASYYITRTKHLRHHILWQPIEANAPNT